MIRLSVVIIHMNVIIMFVFPYQGASLSDGIMPSLSASFLSAGAGQGAISASLQDAIAHVMPGPQWGTAD